MHILFEHPLQNGSRDFSRPKTLYLGAFFELIIRSVQFLDNFFLRDFDVQRFFYATDIFNFKRHCFSNSVKFKRLKPIELECV